MVELRVDRGHPVVADEAPRGAVVRGRGVEVARALARRAAAEVGRRVERVDVQRGAAPVRDGRGYRAARAVVGRAEQARGGVEVAGDGEFGDEAPPEAADAVERDRGQSFFAWFGGPPKVSDPDDPGPDPDARGGCEPPGCVAPFY